MILFNNDWRFLLGDPKNAFREKYPDRTWKHIDLPHDWVISQPFKRGDTKSWTGQNMQGFFAWEGVAWYRKEFDLSDLLKSNLSEKKVFIYFGGAYRNSTVYVNGKPAGGRAYGYSSFELDITGLVREGKNLIAVRLDNGGGASNRGEAPDRWYSGSGLFRNVYVKILPLVYIKNWGVHVSATLKGTNAELVIKTTIVNESGKTGSGAVHVRVFRQQRCRDAASNLVIENTVPVTIVDNEITVNQQMKIQNPALWSAESPNLYTASVSLEIDGRAEQVVEVPVGVRSISIVNHKGMMVNNKPVKLKGVCLHHDCGITGSAFYEAAWRRRLLTLKSIGCNAIRTSHNPPAQEFLDLCDELGFYVIDECFDKWKSGYYAAHFDTDARRDLEDMILRDRNHPSVFMWSLGNEVENQGADSMLKIQKQLAAIVRALDDRPITCALEPHVHPASLIGAPPEELVKITKKLAQDVDVLGVNYHEPLYEYYTAAIDKPIVGTECYEFYCGTASNFADVTTKNPWRYVLESDNVIGQFIWAGIDYFGESPWPAKGWTGSILDICGFMKPNAWFRKSIWSDEPVAYLAFYDHNKKRDYARGRWSFPPLSSHLNCDHFSRRTVTAAIFTNCDEVELWINGKKMGRRSPAAFENGIIEWTFEYYPGHIKVIGCRQGKEACTYELKTAGEAQKLQLTPDTKTLAPGGIAHVEVSVTDKDGVLCPNEELLVDFALSGDGEILGACSPDLTADLGYTLPKVITSGGKALLMLKAGDGARALGAGTLELTAYSEKLKPAALRFKVNSAR